MKPLRHRSPNTKNAYASSFFQSPNKNQANIIDLENQVNMINNRKFNLINNHLSFNYNKDNYNYYDEITNAFNFITYVLKQKDSQIQELKIKIEDLERQLNEINETNMMTFNNKEIIDSSSSSNTYNLKFMKNNKKNNSPDSIRNKNKIMMNNLWKIENEISNNNSNNNINNSKIINLNKKNNLENEKNNFCKCLYSLLFIEAGEKIQIFNMALSSKYENILCLIIGNFLANILINGISILYGLLIIEKKINKIFLILECIVYLSIAGYYLYLSF